MIIQSIAAFRKEKNSPPLHLKAVFFDMDGVLFDSMPFHATSWVKAMQSAGIAFTEYQGYINEGRTGSGTINNEFEKVYGRKATEEEIKRIYQLKSHHFELCGTTPRIPFAYDLLKKIKAQGFQIVLVTGSGQASLLENLERNFPGIFTKDNMITSFDVKHGKPHPEPYLMALQKAKIQPWETVVIENAPLGVEAAAAAGIFTIAINTGILEDEVLEKAGANLVLSGMEELYKKWDDILKAING
jgi:HAD superfamily hydrolase (TIGR01509 family)